MSQSSPQPVLPEDVEKRFDEMYLQITAQDRPVWAGYQYVTHHACIKDFIATELTRLEAEKVKAVEEERARLLNFAIDHNYIDTKEDVHLIWEEMSSPKQKQGEVERG